MQKLAFVIGSVNLAAIRESQPISDHDFEHLSKMADRAGVSAQIFFAVLDEEFHGVKKPKMKAIRAERDRLLTELTEYRPDLIIALGTPACQALFNSGKVAASRLRLVPHDLEDVPAPVWATWSLEEAAFKEGLIRWVDMDVQAAVTGKTECQFGTYYTQTEMHPELAKWRVDVELGRVDEPTVGLDLETYPAFDPWHPDARIRMCVISHRQDFCQIVQATADSRLPDWLVGIIRDPRIRKVGSNIKFDYRWLARFGITMRNFADTAVAEHVIDVNAPAKNLKFLTLLYHPTLGDYSAYERKLAYERGGMEHITDEELYQYAGGDGDASITIYNKQLEIITSKNRRQPFELLTATLPNLAAMEVHGACVSMEENARLDREYSQEISRLREKIRDSLGDINPNAHGQLLEALQKKGVDLETHASKRKKANIKRFGKALDDLDEFEEEYSTEKIVLQREALKYPVVQDVLAYRRVYKLHSVYVKGFRKHVQELNGQHFVRSDYRLDRTRTNRSASKDPNLQNIPRNLPKSMAALNIKRQFISRWADIGGQIAEYDLSQAELRETAMITREPVLVDAFTSGRDVHKEVSARLFDLPYEEITSELRQPGKTLNFGILYGMGPGKLAMELSSQGHPTKLSEASQLLDGYFAGMPVLHNWIQDVHALTLRELEVITRWGFSRRFDAPRWGNDPLAFKIQRQGVNTHPQNGAACWTYCGVNTALAKWRELRLMSLPILTVHDCLAWDVYPGEEEKVDEITIGSMQNPDAYVEMTVPMVVEKEIGPSWAF